jgi:putative transposase
MIDGEHTLSVVRQSRLLGVSRSSVYYRPAPVSSTVLALTRSIDVIHTARPFLGSRRIIDELDDAGVRVSRKCVQRLMRLMGIEAIYQRPKTSLPGRGSAHRVYPYLLNGVPIERANHVWSSDITFIPMAAGFAYLVAIMDVGSRRILSWRLSNTPDARVCVDALEEALSAFGSPEIFNSDQGSQFTSNAFTSVLEEHGVQISMDGKGRWLDNVWIERFWRSLKYEEVYLHAYDSVRDARRAIERYIGYYNHQRRHSSLKRRTPEEAYTRAEKLPPPARSPQPSGAITTRPCS